MIINTLVNKVNSAATKIQLWWQDIVSDKNYKGSDKGKSRGDEQVLIIILFIISLLLF